MTQLTENVIREISVRRSEPEWLLEWRLMAFAAWKKMHEPHWGEIDYAPIDYDALKRVGTGTSNPLFILS